MSHSLVVKGWHFVNRDLVLLLKAFIYNQALWVLRLRRMIMFYFTLQKYEFWEV